VSYLCEKYERLLSWAFKIFKMTDEMCSIMTVTDVSDDAVLSNVESAFTTNPGPDVFSETLVFIVDKLT